MKNDLDQVYKLWIKFRKEILLVVSILIIALGIRSINLLVWPIFADEAIYIRWSQVMKSVPTLRYLPLTDGKQPLYMWLMMPMFKLFDDPLVAGRMLSAILSALGLVGFYLLLRILGNNWKKSSLGLLLAVVTPAWIFYDRMALADGFLMALGIWSIFIQLAILKKIRIDLAIMNGAILGFAWITKSPALFFLAITSLLNLIKWLDHKNTWLMIKHLGLWLISFVIAFVIYNSLRLFPEFHQIALRNSDYLVPMNEFVSDLIGRSLRNLTDGFQFYWWMLTPLTLLISILGIIKLIVNKKIFTLVMLIGWWIGPLITQVLLAKELPGRYLLFTIPAILIFAVEGFEFLFTKLSGKNKIWFKLIIGIEILMISFNVYALIFQPQMTWMSVRDRRGHLEDWTAGYGLREIAEYIKEKYDGEKILLGTEGYFGTTPDGLQIYFDQNPDVIVLGNSHILELVPESLYDGLTDRKVFFVINDDRFKVTNFEENGLKLITSYPKAKGLNGLSEKLLFFEVVKDIRKK